MEDGEMPDTETAETAETEAPASTEETGKPDSTGPDRLPDDHPLVKAYQATKSELTNAKSKVKEFEDATKTEQERLAEKANELEQRASSAEVRALRMEVATEAVPDGATVADIRKVAKYLTGETREDMETKAAELLEDFGIGADDEKPSASRRPQERLRPGAAPDADPEETDPSRLADMVHKAKYGY